MENNHTECACCFGQDALQIEGQPSASAAILEACAVASQRFYGSANIGEVVLSAPQCSSLVKPGQFVHLELPQFEAHVLRRPFSVYSSSAEEQTITLLYQVVGEGTHHMKGLEEGSALSLIGPIGRPWQPGEAKRCLLIGGGVGAAPLFLLAQELKAKGASVDIVLGAATADALICAEAYEELLGPERCHITTDDGSRGLKGFTTQKAQELLVHNSYDYLATCGPEPMQRAVAALAASAQIRCEVSLERRMACGIGACLSCVVPTIEGLKRACVDGPVFKAEEVCW